LTDWRISSDGGNASERVQNRWIADVATMNDEVRIAKRIKRFRPNQTWVSDIRRDATKQTRGLPKVFK
jgi:hypothetical protein